MRFPRPLTDGDSMRHGWLLHLARTPRRRGLVVGATLCSLSLAVTGVTHAVATGDATRQRAAASTSATPAERASTARPHVLMITTDDMNVEDLRHLPRALGHARRSKAIMWQSVGLSLAIIIGLMPLALFGVLGLAAVVLVHEVAEVVVIGNGIRAGRTRRLGLAPGGPATAAPRERAGATA